MLCCFELMGGSTPKIAHCCLFLNKRTQANGFFYKAASTERSTLAQSCEEQRTFSVSVNFKYLAKKLSKLQVFGNAIINQISNACTVMQIMLIYI
ncbi:hypothetical protein Syun_003177 [Stephania yunnanensis]|uniref:Uncharacterized protein n=1 Tax=Stephania yunnanensis TaxID=152371 RepID=A0AAP0L1R9_9MAGN